MLSKRTKGRKRHIVVDGRLGLILAVAVTGANVQDRDGGQSVLKGLKDRFPRLARVWADGAYSGPLAEWAEKTAQFVLDIVCKPRGQIGFSVLPWRWIVERTFAWPGNQPSPRSGLRDQSTHERGLDQNRHDPPYGAKARLSILRQVLRILTGDSSTRPNVICNE
jgi:transposase